MAAAGGIIMQNIFFHHKAHTYLIQKMSSLRYNARSVFRQLNGEYSRLVSRHTAGHYAVAFPEIKRTIRKFSRPKRSFKHCVQLGLWYVTSLYFKMFRRLCVA